MAIKLDIGCGGRGSMYAGFIGIDIWPPPEEPRNPNAEYLQLDFVYTPVLPWQPGTVDEIAALHIIEHLTYQEGQIMLSRAYGLLKPGAKMYVSCPNLKYNATIYLAALDGDIEAAACWNRAYRTGKEYYPGDTFAHKFMHQVTQDTHVWQYDQGSLIMAALVAGCKNVEPMPHGHVWNKRREYSFKGEHEEVGIIITKA